MKVKIFHAGISFMQFEINEWLKKNKAIEILDMRVTSVFESFSQEKTEDSGTMLLIIFLYEENKKDTHPERKYIQNRGQMQFQVNEGMPF